MYIHAAHATKRPGGNDEPCALSMMSQTPPAFLFVDTIRGNHLSNTTCLTHDLFKVANRVANYVSRISRRVMPWTTNEAALDK